MDRQLNSDYYGDIIWRTTESIRTINTATIMQDIRYQPPYTISEVAGYVRANSSTLRTWALGRPHSSKGNHSYPAMIKVADRRRQDMLSFINLIETHVLIALRHSHHVPLPKIRAAVTGLRKETGKEHPLAELDIQTDGLDLFIRHVNQIVSASERGQIVIREVVERFLRRVERDAEGVPICFYPFTQDKLVDESPRDVIIDPNIGFGRSVLQGTRIATAIVFERYKAGDSLLDIAKDYELELRPVEEALRCEIERRAA